MLTARWTRRIEALPREARDTLFLLCVIALIVLPQAGTLPLSCVLLTLFALLWRGWIAVQGKPLPGMRWRIAVLALGLIGVFAAHKTLLGRDAGVTLVIVLLALKTLEMRARRDAFVIFFLGFFAMLTNFFSSQSLVTAFLMLLALLGLLTALVNAHKPVGRPPLIQSARTAFTMALLGAPVMLALFMLFPRMAPLWGTPNDEMTGRSGLSNTMRVGTIARLALDDGIAARIRFDGNITPSQRALYFRGPVLSDFDGRQWTAPAPWERGFFNAELRVRGDPVGYEVTLEPSNRPWLLALDVPQQVPEVPGMRVVITPDLQLIANRPVGDLLRYRAASYPDFESGPLRRTGALERYVALPPGTNPRTAELAAQMKRDPALVAAGTPGYVQAALTRLRTGGYLYTLEPGVYEDDTADEFWFNRKEGFCEHIASAFVVLMRSLDVPARIVTGYQGGERNAVDGFWVVRNSDAHAWAEVWQEGIGWVRVDPTSAVSPGRTGTFERLTLPQGVVGQTLRAISPDFAAQLRATWEAVNNGWNQWVLNYTQGRQLNLLKNIGFESPSWEDLSYVLIGAIVLASAAGGAWTLWDNTQHDPWLRLLARARKRLAKAGIESTAATSPRKLAGMVLAKSGPTCSHAGHAQDQMFHDWLIQLEIQRYAVDAADTNPAHARMQKTRLKQLQQQFGTLVWPA